MKKGIVLAVQRSPDIDDAPSLATLGPAARGVVRALLLGGPLTRAELARRLGLSPASLTKTARPLLVSGLISEGAALVSEQRGRPGAPLVLDAARHQFIGVKLTADEVFAVRADARGRVDVSQSVQIESTEVTAVVAELVAIVNEIGGDHRIQALGIGLAGEQTRFDDTVRRNHYLGWDQVPLAQLVEEATGIPTVLSGDARALTAGVQWSGPGKGMSELAVLTVGVGIGLGIVLEDKVLSGPSGLVGMIGHHRISDSGPLCELGHRGCASSYLTTAAITAAIGVPHGRVDIDLAQGCALAADGDPVARRVLADAGRALGVIIAQLVNILGLPAVILAGDGLELLSYAEDSMQAALAEHLDPVARRPKVVAFTSGFDEWARGAAVVACQWLLDPPRHRYTRP